MNQGLKDIPYRGSQKGCMGILELDLSVVCRPLVLVCILVRTVACACIAEETGSGSAGMVFRSS